MQFSATEAALEAGKWVGGISILGGSLRLLKFKGPDGSSAPLVQPPAGWLRRKSRHALVELSVGGIASSYPPSLPPSLLPIREAAAGALAPTAAPVAPPCCRPHYRLVPARGRALAFPAGGWRGWRCGEGVGGFGGLGLHPSFQWPLLKCREGRSGFFLYGVSLGLPVSSPWKKSGYFTCSLERTFLIHHAQCQARGKVQRSSR